MKSIAKLVCLVATFAAGMSLYATEPYDSIRLVSYEPYFFENGWILIDKVNSQNTTVFIDVESQSGEAARFVSTNTSDAVRVYQVNDWNHNAHGYQTFLSNVVHENQADKITPITLNSKDGSAVLNLISECIFLDCNSPETVYDKILAWSSHLSDHGIIAGNKWGWPEVELTVINAAVELNLALTINSNFWFLAKE